MLPLARLGSLRACVELRCLSSPCGWAGPRLVGLAGFRWVGRRGVVEQCGVCGLVPAALRGALEGARFVEEGECFACVGGPVGRRGGLPSCCACRRSVRSLGARLRVEGGDSGRVERAAWALNWRALKNESLSSLLVVGWRR